MQLRRTGCMEFLQRKPKSIFEAQVSKIPEQLNDVITGGLIGPAMAGRCSIITDGQGQSKSVAPGLRFLLQDFLHENGGGISGCGGVGGSGCFAAHTARDAHSLVGIDELLQG